MAWEFMKPKNGEDNYEMFIEKIEGCIAYCTVVDDDNKKSFMEVPVEDLEKKCDDKLKPGLIFKIIVNNYGEDIDFEYIEQTPTSKEERDKILLEYRKKYGDL